MSTQLIDVDEFLLAEEEFEKFLTSVGDKYYVNHNRDAAVPETKDKPRKLQSVRGILARVVRPRNPALQFLDAKDDDILQNLELVPVKDDDASDDDEFAPDPDIVPDDDIPFSQRFPGCHASLAFDDVPLSLLFAKSASQ